MTFSQSRLPNRVVRSPGRWRLDRKRRTLSGNGRTLREEPLLGLEFARAATRSTLWIALSLVPVPGVADTYFVDAANPDARDDNPGSTRDAPWRTLGKAVRKAGPGDTVIVRPGIYEIDGGLQTVRSGKPDRPISFVAESTAGEIIGNAEDIVEDDHVFVVGGQWQIGHDWIELAGFFFREGGSLLVKGIRGCCAEHVVLRDLMLHNICFDPDPRDRCRGGTNGVGLWVTEWASNITIDHIEMWTQNPPRYGRGAELGILADNTVVRNSHLWMLRNVVPVVASNVQLIGNTIRGLAHGPSADAGGRVGNVLLKGNILHVNPEGFRVNSLFDVSPVRNVRIYGNTIILGGWAGYFQMNRTGSTDMGVYEFKNNVVLNPGGTRRGFEWNRAWVPDHLVSDHNCWVGVSFIGEYGPGEGSDRTWTWAQWRRDQPAKVSDPNSVYVPDPVDVVVDPDASVFINPTNGRVRHEGDFRLKPGSACLGIGVGGADPGAVPPDGPAPVSYPGSR